MDLDGSWAMRPFVLVSLLATAVSPLAGCGDVEPGDDDYEVVSEGKEDNFRSPSALEFSAKADATVTLPETARSASDAERLAQAQELVSAKLLQIGWFLNLYVADKEPGDPNKTYGGFHAMARNASVKSLAITPVDALTFKFNFEATIAGQNKFLSLLPGTPSAGGKKIGLKMGAISNASLIAGDWQSRYNLHSWDPNQVPAVELETLPMVVAPLTRSTNAYLDYNRLYADGKLDVGAQFGWDYNAGRADLAGAEQLFDDLLDIGFASPVARFADLRLGSAPLTRASTFNGRPVQISVKLVHPGMVANPTTDGAQLRAALLDLLFTKEVVLFSGHAGTSGRLLTADFKSNALGTILPTEYPTLPLLDRYQVFLIQGCQTYARFTDGFRQNPKKRGPSGELVNMDIVTSTSYVWTNQAAEAMEKILFPLVSETKSNIEPVTWDDVLRAMNEYPNSTAFMGVNGIDADPRAHPYARADLLGKTCTSSAACGGLGNLCVTSGAKKLCASVCLDDAGCSSGYRCSSVATAGTLAGKACVAR